MHAALFDSCKGYIQAHADRPAKPQPSKLPSITISRETGAGAVIIGQKILEIMQADHRGPIPWALFDRNLVEKIIEDHHLPKTIKKFMPENVRFELTSAVEELLGLHPDSWTLLEHTTDTILRLASAGHAIIVGRGGNVITARLKNVLHVRLIAPIELRIQAIQKLHSLTEREAAVYIHKIDRARQRYLRRYFNWDIDDPLNYHLVLNTGLVSHRYAARVIAEAALHLADSGGRL